ncbi:nidogen-1 isoform X2 [Lingula anatina]|uniref:Nidogen-1 isoform X2 n=1 Tax=Lingula anatina TaxID=7574 RepID=A0A1S3HM29_LINAN|nr:nidogen-1 isoform X2 [Lingula anatina]|eukprot:XP_013386084.1 nidogen-1 isoform X2 [Lingula anatina]
MGTVQLLLVFLCSFSASLGVPREDLYPFGPSNGDKVLRKGDDVSSKEIPLDIDIGFFNKRHRSIFVNSNGHLSFVTELPRHKSDLILPRIGYEVIAVFLADIDTTTDESGNIYYRKEVANQQLLNRASRSIQQHFKNVNNFRAKMLFIATWDRVGYYDRQHDLVNTFQVVLATDGRDTFALFHYVDINWIQSWGKNAPLAPDVPAQAGFDAGDKRRGLTLPGSATKGATNFALWSNVNSPGVWMFHIGFTNGDNVKAADANSGQDKGDKADNTCASQASTCHSDAQCIDYNPGFCCKCVAPFFGNGKDCLEPGVPQRVNGIVTGTINGQQVGPTDLHSYIVTSDGRAYTAVSRIPPSIGYSMQSLAPVGGILGWLFAKPERPGSKNGYMVAGGRMNRTVTVRFQSTGDVLTVRQHFEGHNALNYMQMQTYINGTIPEIQEGQKVTIDDYNEEFRRISAGQMRSYSDRVYRLDGVAYRYSVDQTVVYEACEYEPQDTDSMKLGVSRNFVVYDPKEMIVRYALTNRVSPMASSDPCVSSGQICDENAACTPVGQQYQCRCKNGYQGNGITCEDIDECATGRDTCHPNARCYNTDGGHECRCEAGYVGDGRNCQKFSCNEVNNCDANAECVLDQDTNSYQCECNDGFSGDGLSCSGTEQPEINCQNCHVHAQCIFDVSGLFHRCQCHEGYTGDGKDCTRIQYEIGCNVVNNCDINAQCVPVEGVYQCRCNQGYYGDGQRCLPSNDCSVVNNCDVNAQCLYENGRYQCRCNSGYRGDGQTCQQANDCSVLSNCHPNARCIDVGGGSYQCRCALGYGGDGYTCTPEQCNVIDICDRNAQCVPDAILRRYVCQCREGYTGNGRTCTPSVMPCNQVNNCDPNADCLYESSTGAYRCICRQGYEGDGYACRPGANCRNNPNICDPNAACTLAGSDYVCLCNRGYRGDGKRCYASSAADSYLLYTQGMSIMQVPFNPSQREPGKQVLLIPGQTAIGIDVDCYERSIYWTDVSNRVIRQARLDGSDQKIVIKDLGSPEGVAVDWVSRNMYWSDSALDRIEVARLDGSYRKTLFKTGLVNPRGIAVDPARGNMYWADWNRREPKIEVANMDGTNRRIFVQDNLLLPNGLTMDYSSQQLCWGDAGTQRVECMRIDGVGRRTIYGLASYPFGLASTDTTIYWTDWETKTIPNIDKNGGRPNEALSLPVGGNGKLYGISVVRNQCPAGSNACARNNGGCRFLCLPTQYGGHTCACPDNVDENECNELLLKL